MSGTRAVFLNQKFLDSIIRNPSGIWAVTPIMALALLLRFVGMDSQSLWLDEGYSLWFARQDLSELWGSVARVELNPPLYYMLLHVWTDLFGESVLAMRSLSAMIDCLTIPLVYLTCRWSLPRNAGHYVGLVAAILFALAFSQLQYSQEARTYTLCVLGISIVTAASVRIPTELENLPASPKRWPFVMLGVGAALTLWAHYAMSIALAVMAISHLCVWVFVARASGKAVIAYLFALGSFLLLGGRALWLLTAYAVHRTSDFWVGAPGFLDALDAVSIVFGADFAIDSWSLDLAARAVLFGPWPVIGFIAAWKTGIGHVRLAALFLAVASFGLFMSYLALSYFGHPVFLQRVVLPSQIGWLSLSAMSALYFSTPRLRDFAAGLLVFSFAVGALNYLVFQTSITTKEPWSEIAHNVSAQASPDTTVYTDASGALMLNYYFSRSGVSNLQAVSLNGSVRLPAEHAIFTPGTAYFADPISLESLDRASAQIRSGRETWFVLRNPDRESYGPLRAMLATHGGTEEARHLHSPGPLAVYHFPASISDTGLE